MRTPAAFVVPPALLLLALAMTSLPAVAAAGVPLPGRSLSPKAAPHPGAPPAGWRVGGDTIEDATVIPSLPYADTGNTTGYASQYAEMCPYGGDGPDVVYAFTPGAAVTVDINLCASLYDTKVFVYRDAAGQTIACNDDAGCGYSGWQSRILDLSLPAGHTYYIIVDGYGSESFGEYTLEVSVSAPCELECPSGSLVEGEPPCVDGYIDEYDGGCQYLGWLEVQAQAGGCATVCGKSCTYLFNGFSYRDTDWYTVTATGGTMTMNGTAEFPLELFLIWGTQCNNLQYVYGTAERCQDLPLTRDGLTPGQEVWLWAGPAVFSGVPESDYQFVVCGIEGQPVPALDTTWGRLKQRYR